MYRVHQDNILASSESPPSLRKDRGSTVHIQRTFVNAKQRGEALLIPYICCGYPTPTATPNILLAMQRGGADIIELGCPYSNPFADGPTLKASHAVAIKKGTTGARDCFNALRCARHMGLIVPVVIMGYYQGLMEEFCGSTHQLCQEAAESGVDAFLAVGIKEGEQEQDFNKTCSLHSLSMIQLVFPGTSNERIKELSRMASTFIYVVAFKGKTGTRDVLPPDLENKVARVRSFTELPIVVGFGICTSDMVSRVSQLSDGVVIGSFLTDRLNMECLNLDGKCDQTSIVMYKHISILHTGVKQSNVKYQAKS